jgi:aspartate/methionine/tyrosine aminotransferase
MPDFFSRRVPFLEDTNPFMEKAASRRALPGFLDLVETNPTRAGLIFEAVPVLPLHPTYDPDPRGLLSARQAVAEYYGPQVVADDIVLTASTSEAYSFLFKLLADAEEEILVPVPSYPLFEHLTTLEDLKPKAYALRYTDERWRIDADSLERARSKRTRGLVVVHPNNPTGSFLHPEDITQLRSDLPVIVDEVFFDYPEPDLAFTPERVADARPESLTFSLGGLSKLCALPQAKLAWIRVSGPQDQKSAALERLAFIADAYLSVGTAIQDAAPLLLSNRVPIQRRINERVSRNAAFLKDAVRGVPDLVERTREGGWYAVLELPPSWTGEDFADALLEQNVFVHPGYFYDFEDENLIVLCLLTPESTWQNGIAIATALAGRLS